MAWSQVAAQACLLSGPPGCGKTLFARALAATCDVPLICGSYGDWLGVGAGHQGSMLKAMRKTFSDARDATPSVLFIDEVDSFPDRSTVSPYHAEWETQVVNALLAEIDGTKGREGIVLVAACNHPDKLDPALIRSGRLETHIKIGVPDQTGLARILREHLRTDLESVSLEAAALAALGSTGADCERFVRYARRRARIEARPMRFEDLMAEIDGKARRPDSEARLTAVHEAGHALAARILRPQSLRAVSIRGSQAGAGKTMLAHDALAYRRSDIDALLVIGLAGRAAEEVILGTISGGAGGDGRSDLARVTALAASAETAFGLASDQSLIWTGLAEAEALPVILARNPMLTARVSATLDSAYARAVCLLREHRLALETLTDALLERRTMSGEEVATLLREALP